MSTAAMHKGKYMPLSEANVEPILVSSYDGQNICVGTNDVRYVMGNYLGGGIAGVVYEAYDKTHQRNVAIKMLNPVGYKMASPAALKRGDVIKKGVPVVGNVRGMTMENVYWVSIPNRRELIACYVDGRNGPSSLSAPRELNLEMCVSLWRLDALENRCWPMQREDPVHSCRIEEMKDNEDEDDAMMNADTLRQEEEIKVGDVTYKIPHIPAKYKAFLLSRKTIYREIAHMHKLTGNSVSGQVGGGHENVLKLFDVLEFVQASKSTIFLVLELAGGGELFDRIRSDNGVEESVARAYFSQLLSGVLYCHQLGIVHRDLKPENLLLSESDVLKIADFGLSAHFIAAVSGGAQDDVPRSASHPDNDEDSNVLLPPARFRRLNSIVGSPHYVAPEVLQNARYGYDGRKADMWSIGVILYGLLVGSLPFGKDLPTCPRFLKFCEWIRSLPSDAHTGKPIYDPTVFQPGPIHILSSTSSSAASSSSFAAFPASSRAADCSGLDGFLEDDVRLPQAPPTYGASPSMLLMMNNNATWRSMKAAPVQQHSVRDHSLNMCSNNRSGASAGAAAGRRGSRVVAFPGWFFPAKLSSQAIFLIASLLHPDPTRRFSCEDACKSNWVVDQML
ncbi:TPA: hypothetical protein N0F65_000208 [Lagenidium giganteum]|uniref:non-specific serine/threonine protein kinase n=1 Tax=Lagenidium giganteum TaxID=4803 RepID=A0AAV2YGE2_9STRA|nr:TPA: hypothetical protein N0F65_000208 [Lagenidium giganteum]